MFPGSGIGEGHFPRTSEPHVSFPSWGSVGSQGAVLQGYHPSPSNLWMSCNGQLASGVSTGPSPQSGQVSLFLLEACGSFSPVLGSRTFCVLWLSCLSRWVSFPELDVPSSLKPPVFPECRDPPLWISCVIASTPSFAHASSFGSDAGRRQRSVSSLGTVSCPCLCCYFSFILSMISWTSSLVSCCSFSFKAECPCFILTHSSGFSRDDNFRLFEGLVPVHRATCVRACVCICVCARTCVCEWCSARLFPLCGPQSPVVNCHLFSPHIDGAFCGSLPPNHSWELCSDGQEAGSRLGEGPEGPAEGQC